MNRLALLVVLAACGSDEECVPEVRSQIAHRVGSIASGRELTGVSWIETVGRSAPIHHAAFVADGRIEHEVRVGTSQLFGTAGTESVLWHAAHAGTDCEGVASFGGLLHRRDDENVPLDIAPVTQARGVAFDGLHYQLFWVTDDVLHHVAVDEHGARGAVHDLGEATGCIAAASDRAGTTFLRMAHSVVIVDGATGGMRTLWTGSPFDDYEASFYFAGELHVLGYDLLSIDPATGVSRVRELPDPYIFRFYPAATKLYGDTSTTTLELDASLKIVDEHSAHDTYNGFGTSGDDRIYLEQTPVDGTGRTHLVLSREGSTAWTYEVALDSPVETLGCGD